MKQNMYQYITDTESNKTFRHLIKRKELKNKTCIPHKLPTLNKKERCLAEFKIKSQILKLITVFYSNGVIKGRGNDDF